MATQYIEKFALPNKAGLKRELLITNVNITPNYVDVALKVVTYETVDSIDIEIEDFTFETNFNSINMYFNTSTNTMIDPSTIDIKNLPVNVLPLSDYLKSTNSFQNCMTLFKNAALKAKDANLIRLNRN